MAESSGVGILGIGTYSPPTVRTNDWWPPEYVEQWRAQARAQEASQSQASAGDNPAGAPDVGAVREAILGLAHDPFHGAIERRVMAADQQASDMEAIAARRALEAAGVEAAEISLLLTAPWISDVQGTNAACTVHAALGLPERCLCMAIDSNFNGFHHQMAVAESMIRAGRCAYALLVQSSSVSRVLEPRAVFSPWFGDGATAVVVGPVAEGFGLLGQSHRADGSLQWAFLTGVPGKLWFDEGRSILYSERPERQRKVLAQICSWSGQVISEALAEAELSTEDVDYYGGHQGTWWYRRVTQRNAGLDRARCVDSFEAHASMAACNCPMVLSLGFEQGQLSEGDVVVTHAGGNGAMWSSLVLRWGRGS